MVILGRGVVILTLEAARRVLQELQSAWTPAKAERLQASGVLPIVEALERAVRTAGPSEPSE